MSSGESNNLHALDCAVAFGKNGILVQFSAPASVAPARAFALPARTAALMLHTLQAEMADHEARHGTSWSPQDASLGAEADRRTGLGHGGDLLGAHGADLYRLLKNLPLNGYERSFKLQPGRVLTERFLLGIRLDRLTPAQLNEIIDRMGLPAAWRPAFLAGLADTRFLHFGHEAAPDGTVRKLYQEHAQEGEQNPGTLLYTGYKWEPAQPERRALSQYRAQRGLDIEEMVKRLNDLLPGQRALAAAGAGMLRQAAARCEPRALLYLDVGEEGNSRHSCDINLYAADLTLAEVEPALHDAASGLGISRQQLDAAIAQRQEAQLGHISAGIGRDGAPFMTVYYSLA